VLISLNVLVGKELLHIQYVKVFTPWKFYYVRIVCDSSNFILDWSIIFSRFVNQEGHNSNDEAKILNVLLVPIDLTYKFKK
jgi:hypothetical protein